MNAVLIQQTGAFARWLQGLRDAAGRAAIVARLTRAERGHFGDVRSVGGGVSEMRVHRGPGYRVYFTWRGDALVLLLCGGDKGSQRRDIRNAQAMVLRLKAEGRNNGEGA